jgi:hypothetical protein
MKILRWGRPYIISRAVEEPIEATFDLSTDIKNQSPKLFKAVNIGLISSVFFILTLIPHIFFFFNTLFNIFTGRQEVFFGLTLRMLLLGMVLIIVLAIAITALLFQFQIRKFYGHLFQRYSTVSTLKDAEMIDDVRKDDQAEKKAKHHTNPILAMLDLTEESSHQTDKIINLLTFCRYLFGFLFIFLIVNLIINLVSNISLITYIVPWELEISLISIVLFLISTIFVEDSLEFIIYFQARHEIIDNIRFERFVSVPKGDDPLKRIIKYLSESDPYIKKALGADSSTFQYKVDLKDAKGSEHRFDAYFKGINHTRPLQVRTGIPPGNFSVFIRVFKKPISIADVQRLQKDAVSICEKEDSVPLRTIALQWKILDLDDEVYDFALEKPLIMKEQMFHLQIISEDAGAYSFIPNLSYEKEGG